MGYSADKIYGDSIVIKHNKTEEFANLLREGEARFGHISWCDTVDTYAERNKENYPSVIIAMMADYGFIVDSVEDNIFLYSWGGDKIGSSWDDVWNALAKVADGETVWVMVGEDQQVWAERLANGERMSFSVDFDKLISDTPV